MSRTILGLVGCLAMSLGTAVTAPAAQAQSGGTIYFEGVAYTSDGTQHKVGDDLAEENLLDLTLDTVLQAAKGVSCVPKSTSTTIHDPFAELFYGTTGTIYKWDGLVESEVTGCPDNVVTVKATYRNQALDGRSLPNQGHEAVASAKARAGAYPELVQRFDNIVLANGFAYNALTATVTSSQTDGKTTTTWCATKTWTYLATLTGPLHVGETPTEKTKCGA